MWLIVGKLCGFLTGEVWVKGELTSEVVYRTWMRLFLEGEEMGSWNIQSNPGGRPEGEIMDSAPRICTPLPVSRQQPAHWYPPGALWASQPVSKAWSFLGLWLQFMMLSDYQTQFVWQWKKIVLWYCLRVWEIAFLMSKAVGLLHAPGWERELVARALSEKSQDSHPSATGHLGGSGL